MVKMTLYYNIKVQTAAKEKDINDLSTYWKSQNASRATQIALAGRMRPAGRVFETSALCSHLNDLQEILTITSCL